MPRRIHSICWNFDLWFDIIDVVSLSDLYSDSLDTVLAFAQIFTHSCSRQRLRGNYYRACIAFAQAGLNILQFLVTFSRTPFNDLLKLLSSGEQLFGLSLPAVIKAIEFLKGAPRFEFLLFTTRIVIRPEFRCNEYVFRFRQPTEAEKYFP